MAKYKYCVVFQSKAKEGNKWKDVKKFHTDSSFYLPSEFQDEISKMKREYKYDLPKFKVRTVNRRTLN